MSLWECCKLRQVAIAVCFKPTCFVFATVDTTAGAKVVRPRRSAVATEASKMFSLDSSDKARRKQNIVLASLTDSLNIHQAPWQRSRVKVFAPRISAKRVPGKQLRVVRAAPVSPAAILHLQRQRAVHAAVALSQQVGQARFASPGVYVQKILRTAAVLELPCGLQVQSLVLSWKRVVVHTLSLAAFHVQARRGLVQHSQASSTHLKLPWRRHAAVQTPDVR